MVEFPKAQSLSLSYLTLYLKLLFKWLWDILNTDASIEST